MPMDPGGAIPMMVRRLDGIESELRELRGLMAQLVRVEERSNADRAEVGRLHGELRSVREEFAGLREELGKLRDSTRPAVTTIGYLERLFWLAVAAGIGLWGNR